MSEYNCEICKYSTNRKANLDRHLVSSRHLNKVNPPPKKDIIMYPCSFEGCTYSCKRKFNIQKHEKTHAKTVTHTVKCMLCQKSFPNKVAAIQHHRTLYHKQALRLMYQAEGNKINDERGIMLPTFSDEVKREAVKRVNARYKVFEKCNIQVDVIDVQKMIKCEDSSLNKILTLKTVQQRLLMFPQEDVTILKMWINQGLDWMRLNGCIDNVDEDCIKKDMEGDDVNTLSDDAYQVLAEIEDAMLNGIN